jgi:hypothetical protein
MGRALPLALPLGHTARPARLPLPYPDPLGHFHTCRPRCECCVAALHILGRCAAHVKWPICKVACPAPPRPARHAPPRPAGPSHLPGIARAAGPRAPAPHPVRPRRRPSPASQPLSACPARTTKGPAHGRKSGSSRNQDAARWDLKTRPGHGGVCCWRAAACSAQCSEARGTPCLVPSELPAAGGLADSHPLRAHGQHSWGAAHQSKPASKQLQGALAARRHNARSRNPERGYLGAGRAVEKKVNPA